MNPGKEVGEVPQDTRIVELWTEMGRQTGGLIGRSIGLSSYGLLSVMEALLAPAVLLNSALLSRNRRF